MTKSTALSFEILRKAAIRAAIACDVLADLHADNHNGTCEGGGPRQALIGIVNSAIFGRSIICNVDLDRELQFACVEQGRSLRVMLTARPRPF